MAAGVHPHGAADRAGHADHPLQPGPARRPRCAGRARAAGTAAPAVTTWPSIVQRRRRQSARLIPGRGNPCRRRAGSSPARSRGPARPVAGDRPRPARAVRSSMRRRGEEGGRAADPVRRERSRRTPAGRRRRPVEQSVEPIERGGGEGRRRAPLPARPVGGASPAPRRAATRCRRTPSRCTRHPAGAHAARNSTSSVRFGQPDDPCGRVGVAHRVDDELAGDPGDRRVAGRVDLGEDDDVGARRRHRGTRATAPPSAGTGWAGTRRRSAASRRPTSPRHRAPRRSRSGCGRSRRRT